MKARIALRHSQPPPALRLVDFQRPPVQHHCSTTGDVLQAEGALAAQKRAEADAGAAAKAHEATLASEKEHYSSLLQKARASQVRSQAPTLSHTGCADADD